MVPTRQRRAFLEETLTHLAQTDYPPERLEVFVVDAGSSDGTDSLVREFARKARFRVRWHVDPSLRLSGARNYAIRETAADIVISLDDDCITPPGWVRNLVLPIMRGECDLAGGADRAPDDDPFLARCEDIAFSSIVGSGGARKGGRVAVTGFCPTGCNMAMRRDKILSLGCFDENLKAVEDTDFVYKCRAAGWRVAFIPSATVLHRRRATLRAICFHNYIRGYGRMLLWQRYGVKGQLAFALPAFGLVAAAVLLLAGIWWRWAWWLLLAGGCIYGLLLAVAAVEGVRRTRRVAAAFVVPFLLVVHHVCYALGLFHGPLTGYRKLSLADPTHLSDPFGHRSRS